MKFKITTIIFVAANLLFFTGCGVSQLGSSVSLTSKQGVRSGTDLPPPAPHARNTDSTTRSIENAFSKSRDLEKTYLYADIDGSNVLLTGIVANEKQKFIASAIANSFVNRGMVINRVEIYRPITVKNASTPQAAQTKK
jgi:osmotically-inducible protein OsmY